MAVRHPRALIVVDDPHLQTLIARPLTASGFRVRRLANWRMALDEVHQQNYDLVVLDMHLADGASQRLYQELREQTILPIMAVCAQGHTGEQLVACSLDADAQITLPFDHNALLAHAHGLLQEEAAEQKQDGIWKIGHLEVDLIGRCLLRDGRAIRFSELEWQLLEVLIRHAGQVLTHRILLQRVWGDADGANSDYLYTYIRRLRNKLELDPTHPRLLRTEPGIGYRFVTHEAYHEQPLPRAAEPSIASAPIALPTRPTQLPKPFTSLLGRAADLQAIQQRFAEPSMRLLTIIGPPGVGKSRVGLQAAEALSTTFADGVIFVDLATIQTQARFVARIAELLGLTGTASLGEIQRQIAERQLLLVLDNFEHLLPAKSMIAELLGVAAQLRTLISSRVALGLAGEHVYQLAPLGLSCCSEDEEPAALQLFTARTQAIQPEFVLDQTNLATVAAICARLDGLPLAIELISSWLKVLSPCALLDRLDQRLELLGHGGPDRPAHQQSMRQTLDWSYGQLDAAAQRLFELIGVFRGGFRLEALEALMVASKARDLPQGSSLLTSLAALVDHSLLQQQRAADGLPRFSLLELIREYALERLERRGELGLIRQQHALYYLNIASQAAQALQGSERTRWLQRLEDEHANLREAIGWALGQRASSMALEFGRLLWRFWLARGYFSEGRKLLEAALQMKLELQPSAALHALRAQVLDGAGVMAHNQGDFAHARRLYAESLEIYLGQHDITGRAQVLSHLAVLANDQSDYPQARQFGEESLSLFRRACDQRGAASALINLSLAALTQGDYGRARPLCEESLSLCHALDDQPGMAMALNNLGCVVMDADNDYARARTLFVESRQLFETIGDTAASAACLDNLGLLALYQSDCVQAETFFQHGLRLAQTLEDRHSIARFLNHLGLAKGCAGMRSEALALVQESLALHQAQGDLCGVASSLESLAILASPTEPLRAAQFAGRAEALREAIAAPQTPPDRLLYQAALTNAHTQVGGQAWAKAWNEGRSSNLETTQLYALSLNNRYLALAQI